MEHKNIFLTALIGFSAAATIAILQHFSSTPKTDKTKKKENDLEEKEEKEEKEESQEEGQEEKQEEDQKEKENDLEEKQEEDQEEKQIEIPNEKIENIEFTKTYQNRPKLKRIYTYPTLSMCHLFAESKKGFFRLKETHKEESRKLKVSSSCDDFNIKYFSDATDNFLLMKDYEPSLRRKSTKLDGITDNKTNHIDDIIQKENWCIMEPEKNIDVLNISEKVACFVEEETKIIK